jgi:hypothetical protein
MGSEDEEEVDMVAGSDLFAMSFRRDVSRCSVSDVDSDCNSAT